MHITFIALAQKVPSDYLVPEHFVHLERFVSCDHQCIMCHHANQMCAHVCITRKLI